MAVQPADPKAVALDALGQLNDTDKKEVAVAYMKQLGPSAQKEVVQKGGVLQNPDSATVNFIWKIIVIAFVIVLLVAAAGLAYNALAQTSVAQVLITIFTTAVGFLAGLLAPSPAQNKQSNP